MILLKKRLSPEKLFELMKGKYILISKNIDTQLWRWQEARALLQTFSLCQSLPVWGARGGFLCLWLGEGRWPANVEVLLGWDGWDWEALLHYNYTAWTSFIIPGLHSHHHSPLPGYCHSLIQAPGNTDTRDIFSRERERERERGGRC